MKKKEYNRTSRRSFLKKGLTASSSSLLLRTSPFLPFFEAIFKKAYGLSDEAGSNINNYVGILMIEGPPRWLYDLPLTPTTTDKDNFDRLFGVGTRQRSGGGEIEKRNFTVATEISSDGLVYSTEKIGNYQMPLLWNKNIPTRGGGTKKIEELLKNMIMLRGYTLGTDGHVINQIRHFRPNATGNSIDGVFGSISTRPIPSVAYGASYGFSSPSGSPQVSISSYTSSPIKKILENFKKGTISSSKEETDEAFDAILGIMEGMAHANNVPLRNVYENRRKAKKIFKAVFSDLETYYSDRSGVYEDLQRRCLQDAGNRENYSGSTYYLGDNIEGHDFYEIPSSFDQGNRKKAFYNGYTGQDKYQGFDFRRSLNSDVHIHGLAGSLAVSEFLLKEKLTSALSLTWGRLSGLYASNQYSGGSKYSVDSDPHGYGVYPHLIHFSKYFQLVSIGLYEFREFLKEAGLFNTTAIQLSGDFNRSATADGSGSDHGWDGSNTTLFSGMIQEHEVFGNCVDVEGDWNSHRGFWGKGATMECLKEQLDIGHVLKSVTTMLDIDSNKVDLNALSQKPSVVKKENGVVSLSQKESKNVYKLSLSN